MRYKKAKKILLFWCLFVGIGANIVELKTKEKNQETLGFW